MLNNDFFTGNGATGVAIEDAATVRAQAGAIWDYLMGGGIGGLDEYRNPGKVHGYGWMYRQSAADRLSQANTLLSHRCARGSELGRMLSGLPSSVYQSAQMRQLVLNAPNQTRGEFITLVANHYNLDPELVGAIILTEQRDQSAAADLTDYIAAYHRDRRSTSIGLGQVRVTTCLRNNLLDRIFSPAMFSPMRFPTSFVGRLLADDALNIEATARYIRLVANAGAEVENQNTNSLHMGDVICQNPPNGRYENTSLQHLASLTQPSAQWSQEVDQFLPATVPAVLKDENGNRIAPPSADEWRIRFHGYYCVRLIGYEYTSCPFDPNMLANGITLFDEDIHNPGEFIYNRSVHESIGDWGWFVADAFDDCKRSSAI